MTDKLSVSTSTLSFPSNFTPHPSHGLQGTPVPVAPDHSQLLRPPEMPAPGSVVVPTRLSTDLTQAQKDADYYRIALPSNFHFYPFKELSAKLVRGKQQAKFTRAAASASEATKVSVEAVTSLLGDGINALDLTIPDFFYVLYWLKLNSYTKLEYNHVFMCENAQHLKDVAEGVKPFSTLKGVHRISKTNLAESELSSLPAVPEDIVADGLNVQPQFMRDCVELEALRSTFGDQLELRFPKVDPQDVKATEERNQRISEAMQEMLYLGTTACLIARVQTKPEYAEIVGDGSLAKRLALVEELPAHVVEALRTEWSAACGDYGVKESISVRCMGCGAATRTEIRVAASDFS